MARAADFAGWARAMTASLLQTVETALRTSATTEAAPARVQLVERADGSIEVWPELPVLAGPNESPDRRGAILARCLASLQASGHCVELVCRGQTFVRCRA